MPASKSTGIPTPNSLARLGVALQRRYGVAVVIHITRWEDDTGTTITFEAASRDVLVRAGVIDRETFDILAALDRDARRRDPAQWDGHGNRRTARVFRGGDVHFAVSIPDAGDLWQAECGLKSRAVRAATAKVLRPFCKPLLDPPEAGQAFD